MPVAQCNGADLYYEEYGEGQPIVFLHGAWAGIRFFEPQLQGLSDDHRPIAFDFRGHGRSEKTEAGHTIAQYAQDLRSVLEQLSLDDVILVGWSLGALVSWEYVDQFGSDRLTALVNVDMEPSPGQWLDNGEGRYDARKLRQIHAGVQQNHWQVSAQTQEDLLKDPDSSEYRTMMFDEVTRCPPSIKSAIILDATTCNYEDVLTEIDVPMLVCAGMNEKWRSVESVKRTAALVPDDRFERFEESSHCLTIEEPDRFNEVLRDFIEAV